jgi:spermidine synthase
VHCHWFDRGGGGAWVITAELPSTPQTATTTSVRPAEVALLASVFVVAACGLVYELIASTLASYLLGDSILQFSTVIGTYLFAMGVGSYLSRFFERQLIAHFLNIELLVGLVGGLMPAALFALQSLAPPSLRHGDDGRHTGGA